MIDYKALEALSTVIQLNSFELAAQALHITQPAVSQRIKSLENTFGLPLLQRTQPYQPTQQGEILISHYLKTKLLESNLSEQFRQQVTATKLSVALNRDSMDTWFYQTLPKLELLHRQQLEIIAVDQELTLNYFKKGLVSACVSTQDKSISGCEIEFLGYMDYLFVATPEFAQQYFKGKGSAQDKCRQAPAVIFDANDNLHHRYMKHYFNINESPVSHKAPSVQCFRAFVLAGYGCALVPRIDIQDKLDSGKLVQIYAKKIWRMPLYWHYWSIASSNYRELNHAIIAMAQQSLAQT